MSGTVHENVESPDIVSITRDSGTAKAAEFVRAAIRDARLVETPFVHLEFDRVFPVEIYQAMVAQMPDASDYRPMSGRVKTQGENPTRVKLDLFPEYVRRLPEPKRQVWSVVGRVLRSRAVKTALVERFATQMSQRFGPGYASVGLYPIPILTRDVVGYSISPHTDTQWKGITVQFYLPPDESALGVGTVFHERLPDGSLVKRSQMRFAPNTGYAFVVGQDTWHSVETVGAGVRSRDSILLTYFVDAGALRTLRNRGRRVGNFVLNEVRHLTPSR